MCIMLQSLSVRAILSPGIKIPKVDRWSMELASFNILFVHIKGNTMYWQIPSPG